MKSPAFASLTLLLTVACSNPGLAAPGDAIIRWGTTVVDANAPSPNNVLGLPNGNFSAVGSFQYLWVRNFERKRAYLSLAKFLGVSDIDLARADIIAFEGNGGAAASGLGWECSTWFVSDLRRAAAETFDETVGLGTITTGRRLRFKTGDMLGADYGACFGVAVAPTEHFSWILIDVPNDIDVLSPNFSIWVSGADVHPGAGGDEGTPDPEVIGVLN